LAASTSVLGRQTPHDSPQLERYRFFKRLGYFGVTPDTPRRARLFLRTASHIVQQLDSMLWITPQGAFADPPLRPIRFQTGLGHLARIAKAVRSLVADDVRRQTPR